MGSLLASGDIISCDDGGPDAGRPIADARTNKTGAVRYIKHIYREVCAELLAAQSKKSGASKDYFFVLCPRFK